VEAACRMRRRREVIPYAAGGSTRLRPIAATVWLRLLGWVPGTRPTPRPSQPVPIMCCSSNSDSPLSRENTAGCRCQPHYPRLGARPTACCQRPPSAYTCCCGSRDAATPASPRRRSGSARCREPRLRADAPCSADVGRTRGTGMRGSPRSPRAPASVRDGSTIVTPSPPRWHGRERSTASARRLGRGRAWGGVCRPGTRGAGLCVGPWRAV
jgi:hypothetical protein